MDFLQTLAKLWSKYYYVFLEGLAGTLWLSALTVFFGTLLGVLVAIMGMCKYKVLNGIVKVYIQVLRGTPILLQLYFFWIALPKIIPLEMSDTACIVVALIVNSSSYISEVIRAGIGAVDKGQWEAAKSLGMSDGHMMRRIILPQAIKNILPALGNEFIVMVKETSLASVFFIGELTTSYKSVQTATFLSIPSLTIVGIIYLVLNSVLSLLVTFVERRMKVSD